MGNTTDELIKILEQIIVILESDNEENWRNWCISIQDNLKGSDFTGITKLLQGFGGMGSFNDLVVGQSFEDGEFLWKKGANSKNNKLSKLRRKAFKLGLQIKNTAEFAD